MAAGPERGGHGARAQGGQRHGTGQPGGHCGLQVSGRVPEKAAVELGRRDAETGGGGTRLRGTAAFPALAS